MDVNRRKRKDLTLDQIQYVIDQHIRNLKTDEDGNDVIDGKLKVKSFVAGQLAIKIDCHKSTIYRVWARALEGYYKDDTNCFKATPLKKKNCGRKQKYNRDDLVSEIKELPFRKRRTFRKLATALGMPVSTVHHIYKDKRRPNVITPPHKCNQATVE
jgi:hypothetical protein